MSISLRCLMCFTLFAALMVAPLLAQTGNGVVQGTVFDATKAAIPNANVILRNTATGVSRTIQTSGVGIYYFGSVPIGPYTLSVMASGFKRWEGTLNVEVGHTATIDVAMEVGSVESTVEVTGAAPVVSTEGMQVSDVKDALRIHQLPLNGRLVTNLFNLTPGVESITTGNPRTNGLKVGSTEMLLDGISLVGRNNGGMALVQPGLDTIQEYRIETAGSGAQYSRPATVTLITRSGTNTFHGGVFDTHRNNFGGLRTRRREDGNTASKLIRNEFGVSAGGPILKNKTFWFASYEGLRHREARFAQAAAPTPAIWGGDFSTATTTAKEKITVYDPFSTRADGTRTPFAGNKITPTTLITPFAQTMRSVSPDPAGPNAGGNPWIEPNFVTYYPVTTDTNTITLKGDHVFSEKDNLSGRFTRSWQMYKLFGGQYGYPKPGTTDAGGTGLKDYKDYSAVARWNHVFSPTFLNEFQAAFHRAPIHFGTLADSTNWGDKLGLPNPFGANGWPTICASGSSPFLFANGCWDADNRNDHNMTHFQIDDNMTWIKGKHTMKFGFKGREEYNNYRILQQFQGSHTFASDWTAQYDLAARNVASFTGSGFASLLLGLPTFLSNQYNRGYFYFRQKELGLYFQDSWKVTSRLTLDLGLRWDKWTPYSEKYDRLVNLDMNDYIGKMQVITPHNTQLEEIPGIPPSVLASWKARGLSWVTADSIGFPGNLVPSENKNFGPRLGAAYRLTSKWVVRAGFGMYYWPLPLSQILASAGTTSPGLGLRFSNTISNLNGTYPFYALTRVPSPNDFVGRAAVDVNGIVPISTRAQSVVPWDVRHWSDDQAREWTFNIERELMKDTALRLSYIGTQGRNLEQRGRFNDPEAEWNYQARTGLAADSGNPDPRRRNPNWTAAAIAHNGYSNSHSLQAEIERRYSNGLAFQWFYVFSRARTTSDTGASWGSSSINTSASGGDDISASTGQAYAVPENIVIFGEPNLTFDQRLRFGYANSDAVPAQRIRWNGIYDLPFGKGKKFGGSASRAADALIGGWQIAFIGEWRSGMWSSVTATNRLFGDPTLSADQRLEMNIFGRRQRLWFRGDFDPTFATEVDQAKLQQLVPVARAQRVLRPVGNNFDNRIPQLLANGSVRNTSITDMLNWNARNFYRGPGFWNEDLSLFKNFQITERVKTRFTADFFNFFNHPNDVTPNQTTGLQDLSVQANDPRIIQLSLRVEW